MLKVLKMQNKRDSNLFDSIKNKIEDLKVVILRLKKASTKNPLDKNEIKGEVDNLNKEIGNLQRLLP